jgi:predicted nucleic acid-binding protein
VIVVSDTSPIRAIACLGLMAQLGKMFDQVLMPAAVATELAVEVPGVGSVNPSDWPFIVIAEPEAGAVGRLGLLHLGRGEAEAIALAVDRRIEVLLADDWGARQAASSCGLTPLGVLGLLVRAKQQGHVGAVAPSIDRLVRDISFRISPAVRQEVLRMAGEVS